MNKDRRRRLAKASPLVTQAVALLAQAREIVADARDEERDAVDAMSDAQRDSDHGAEAQEARDALEEALEGIDAVDLRETARRLDDAAGTDTDVAALAPADPGAIEAAREARLPEWAKTRIARAEADAARAREALASAFAPTTGAETEIAINDHGDMHGRTVPARRVSFPALGVAAEVRRGRGGMILKITGDGPLKVVPEVSNSLGIALDER